MECVVFGYNIQWNATNEAPYTNDKNLPRSDSVAKEKRNEVDDDDNEEEEDADEIVPMGALDEQWNAVQEMLYQEEPPSLAYRTVLEGFVPGIQRNHDQQEQLSKLYHETYKTYQDNTEQTLKFFVPIHEHITEQMDQLEQDLIHHWDRNHTVRQKIQAKLQRANAQWETQYHIFLQKLGLTAGTNNAIPRDTKTSSQHQFIHGETKMPHQDEGNEEVTEPDWEALMELDPSSIGPIQTYLQGRCQWQLAWNDFSDALDEYANETNTRNDTILHSIEQTFSKLAQNLDNTMQKDIQFHLIGNVQRRDELNQILDQVQQQQRSIMARLIARVQGNGDDDKSNDNNSVENNNNSNNPLSNQNEESKTLYSYFFRNPFRQSGTKRKEAPI